VSVPPELLAALIAAADELYKSHGWTLDDEAMGNQPEPDGEFVTVLAKHIAPLLDPEERKRARVAALRAEIAQIEACG
jgi:hypothetical protein